MKSYAKWINQSVLVQRIKLYCNDNIDNRNDTFLSKQLQKSIEMHT